MRQAFNRSSSSNNSGGRSQAAFRSRHNYETRKYSYSAIGLSEWVQISGDLGCCFGLDLGGTLSKVVYFDPDGDINKVESKAIKDIVIKSTNYGETGFRDKHLSFYSKRLGGTFHFIRFESSHIKDALKILSHLPSINRIKTIHATGGGAHKYSSLFKGVYGIKLRQHDELETVVRGIVFAVLELPNEELYTYQEIDITDLEADSISEAFTVPFPVQVSHGSKFIIENLFPFLVVNIGSGVSILKVESPTEFERISGTALGGGTYYGLCKILGLCRSFDEAMNIAEVGDSRKVNLLVRDIYGGEWDKHGLSGDVTASFFGKAAALRNRVPNRVHAHLKVGFWERLGLVVVAFCCGISIFYISKEIRSLYDMLRLSILFILPFSLAAAVFYPFWNDAHKYNGFSDKDISRALVVMVAQNVTQIAYLNARLQGTTRVVFTGNFLRHNKIAQYTLSRMMKKWSGSEITCLYMKHEGYFGAMGSFLFSSKLQYEFSDSESDEEKEI